MAETQTDPAVEVTPGDASTEGGDAVEEFALPEGFTDRVKSWEVDDLSKVDEWVQLGKALQTEEGVIDGFITLGQRLGLGTKDLERLFAEEQAAAPAPAVPTDPPKDPDRLLTAAEVEQLLNERVIEPNRQQQEAQQKQWEAQRQKQAADSVSQWFDSNEVPQDERVLVATLAQQLLPANADTYDPRTIANALERGKVQYEAMLEKQAQAYIAKKAAQGSALPTPVSGGNSPGGGEADDKPAYNTLGQTALETARARVRARLRAAGELD